MKAILKTLLFLLTMVLLSQCEKEIELSSVNTSVTNITSISADLVGEVTSDGGGNIQGRGFMWAATNSPTSIEFIMVSSGDDSFSSTVYSFLPNTTYNVKAYAYNKKGVTYGEEKIFTTLEPLQDTFTDVRDGNIYKWIEIGNQIWMAENLNYHADSGCWVYDNDTPNAEIYGRLYNWETAKQVCPTGWHLPTDNEWKQLEMFLGMSREIADNEFYRGLDVGSKLKEVGTAHWASNPAATNSSGFSALPAGVMGWVDSAKYFHNRRYTTTFWTSTEQTFKQAWLRDLYCTQEGVNRTFYYKTMGFSVRCVKVK